MKTFLVMLLFCQNVFAASGSTNIPNSSWKPPVSTQTALPVNGNQTGDARVAKDTETIYIWSGSAWVPVSGGGGGGSGTVTSVAMTVPGFLSIGGSPITTSGTLAVGLATELANTVFSGPTNGSAATPTFRSLVAADIPSLSYISALTGDVTASGSGSVAATIASAAVTNAKLANMAAHTYKGNNTGISAVPLDVTSTQLTADLNQFTSSLQGLAPSSGGGTTNFLRADGTWAAPTAASTTSFGATFDGGGSVIATGFKGYLVIPYAGTIKSWTILASTSGSIVVDVLKSSYAGFPPSVSIAGSELPTLSSQSKNQNLTISTWTASVSAGDIIEFTVNSASVVTYVTLSITVSK